MCAQSRLTARHPSPVISAAYQSINRTSDDDLQNVRSVEA